MRDLFDDFMDELRRREAAARGEDPAQVPPRRPPNEPEEPPPDPDGDEDPPRPLRTRVRRDDGTGGGFRGRAGRAGRRAGYALAALLVLAVLILFAVGLELWTDALWFQTVGYTDVYWTRIGAQVGLFAGGLHLSLAVLLGNLWLAARLTPPPGPGGGTLRSFFERLNEAAEAAEAGRTGGARRWDPAGERRAPRPTLSTDDLPDLTPLAGWVLGALAVFVALGAAGSLASAWETVLLWQNRVPFSTAEAVTDPIFGRDISFFLFELPFLRLVQAVFNGLVVGGLFVALARYLVGAMRGGSIFSTTTVTR